MKATAIKPVIVPEGRVDRLAHEMLKAGLKLNGNPGLRILAKMGEEKIAQALTETAGPGTPVGEAAKKLVEALNEFERKFIQARAQVEAEDWE